MGGRGALPLVLLLCAASPVQAQSLPTPGSAPGARAAAPAGMALPWLRGTVGDARTGRTVADADVTLDRLGTGAARRTLTGADGAWTFEAVPRGRYLLSVRRVGYHVARLTVSLERAGPLSLTVLLDPDPLPLEPLGSSVEQGSLPTLVAAAGSAGAASAAGARSAALRAWQRRSLATDAHRLDREDLREAIALAEHDVFRTLQRRPGVATRDGYSADLWVRGAGAGQTAVHFDGVPLFGGFHALGVLGGLNTDMLSSATLLPGVAGASHPGAGAAVIDVTSRSGAEAPGRWEATVAPLSTRLTGGGQPTDRVAWAAGVRRSHVHALPGLARGIGITTRPLPYAFTDATGRLDVDLGGGRGLEVSGFWQDDGVFGDVPGVAHGNEGRWGSLIGRASLVLPAGGVETRHTLGTSRFDASVLATPAATELPPPLHPATDHRYRTLLWESRVEPAGAAIRPWSFGLRATRELHDYEGPGIDPARLLSREELVRRGIADLTPLLRELDAAPLRRSTGMTRVGLWGERRARLGTAWEVEAGLRLETGDDVNGERVRLAPRLHLRWEPTAPVSFALGWGRSWQYVQSVARTDVLRSGLRVSEVLVQSGPETPALGSDVVTLGGRAWLGETWLLGGTLWGRASEGLLLPDPSPGVLRGVREPAVGRARAWGLEASARRVEGRVRGFATYSLARSRHHADSRWFDAPEDRRHVANVGGTVELPHGWRLGSVATAQSGAPYTRLTLVDQDCNGGLDCDAAPPVLLGAPGGQRAPGWASVDLTAEWAYQLDDLSLVVYGQLHNALGWENRATYHASCLCASGEDGRGVLRDTFDRGLPRLPLIGLRARFR